MRCAPYFPMAARTASAKPSCSQSQQREPVVAAIKIGQVSGKLHRIHVRHLADERRQIHRIECARRQPGAALAQRGQGLVEAATDAAGRGEMGEPEWVQRTVIRSYVRKESSKIRALLWINWRLKEALIYSCTPLSRLRERGWGRGRRGEAAYISAHSLSLSLSRKRGERSEGGGAGLYF